MIVEQPQHLTRLIHQKTFPLILGMSITFAIVMSLLLVSILFLKASRGEILGTFRWIVALSYGPVGAVGILMLSRKLSCRSRHLELRGDGVRLSNCGLIYWNRVLDWTIAPWSGDNRVTRITVRYRFGFGHQRWSILLDDTEQIAKLRDRFAELASFNRTSIDKNV